MLGGYGWDMCWSATYLGHVLGASLGHMFRARWGHIWDVSGTSFGPCVGHNWDMFGNNVWGMWDAIGTCVRFHVSG